MSSIATTQSTTTTVQNSTPTPSSTPLTSTVGSTTTENSSTTVTLPSLNEILNGRTVQAFNSIINISDLTKVQTLEAPSKVSLLFLIIKLLLQTESFYQTSRVLSNPDSKSSRNVIFQWKPIRSSTSSFDTLKARTKD